MNTNTKKYERQRSKKNYIRKAKIEVLIEKHRPHTPKTLMR